MGSNPSAEVEIAAPIDVVWSVMLDTDRYPEWNPFITVVKNEGWPSRLRLVRGTRHQRLTEEDAGTTRYETVEEFSGPLVALAGPDRVADGFRRHAEALKERAESLARRTP